MKLKITHLQMTLAAYGKTGKTQAGGIVEQTGGGLQRVLWRDKEP